MLTLQDTHEAAHFRTLIKEWVEVNVPEELRWAEDYDSLLQIDRILASGNYLALSWPIEYGGRGLSHEFERVLTEELGRAGIQRAKSPSHQGINNLGPTLIKHGTEQQKRQHLSAILQVDAIWCQGFSEPDAGSDLAAVRTVAERDGEEYVLNGSKIWTSNAHNASWMYALVRSGSLEERHKSLSFFVFPMASEGITVRPIRQIDGRSDFSQVFLDNVRVSADGIVGEAGAGWRVAMSLLTEERLSGRHRYALFRRELDDLASMVKNASDDAKRVLVRDLGRCLAEIEGMGAIGRRVESMLAANVDPGPVPSVNKLWWPAAHQRLMELGLNAATFVRGDPTAWFDGWVAARPESVYGGSAQIQRNIIADRYLGLPK